MLKIPRRTFRFQFYRHVRTSSKVAGTRISDLLSREESIAKLKSGEEYDVLIIGGGSTGVGTALDGATRGLKVALIERNDFASGTSSRSTKLLHGGIRYMQAAFLDKLLRLDWNGFKGNMKLVIDALRERNHLLETAPHLTHWIPIMVPFYSWFRWPHSLLIFGMKIYDALAGFPRHSYVMLPHQTKNEFPMIKQGDLKYTAVFWEGMQNDCRTALTIGMTAASKGAIVANYVEALDMLKEGERVVGAVLRDRESGETFQVRSKSIVFAGGPYTDGMRKMENAQAKNIIQGAGGTHIVVPNYYAPRGMGLADMATSDGRILFFLPWLDHTIVGTTDRPSGITDWPKPQEEEIQWILLEVEKYLSKDLKVRRSDVLSAWNGIRPLVSDSSAKNTASVSRDHTIISNKATGTITICGGKWTTYREMAEHAIDAVLNLHPELNKKATPCITLKVPLLGSEGYSNTLAIKLAQKFGFAQSVSEHLAHTYGVLAFDVAYLAAPTKEQWPTIGKRIVSGYPYLEAEIQYAISEYCRTVTDMIAHRTRLAFLNVDKATEAIPIVAEIMGKELSWSEARVKKEISDAHTFLSTFGGPVPMNSSTQLRTRKDLLDAFRRIDVDKSGRLSLDEVKHLCVTMGAQLSGKDLDDAIKELDRDMDGDITFDDFFDWWSSSDSEVSLKLKSNITASTKAVQDAKTSGGRFG